MEYVAIALLSLISCGVGFAREIADSNVLHLENGRQPNASAALFPAIPFVTIAYVFVAWLGNLLYPNAGLLVVVAYFVMRVADQFHQIAESKRRLTELQEKHVHSPPEA